MNQQRKVAATTGSAIGLSAMASFVGLCCIGPWAVGFLGVGGAVALARWQPYREWILLLAATMLLWAFWRVYRPAGFCPDSECPVRRSIWLQILLWCSVCLLGLAYFADQLQWILVDPTPEALRQ